ncbi:MAG: spermidine/putrescine ABC transporter substrate-binding protein [Clostridia bacterium]|nr:spermidine/putrescine ABC transporter substrate-binding protein [Clostridia bacterium]
MRFSVLKKTLASVLAAVLAAGMMSGCGGGGDAQTLHVYNWSEYIPQEVYDKFEEETGIKVVETTFSSNEEMLAKLTAGGSDQYDIVIASNYVIPAMQEQGLIKELNTENIPNFGNIYEMYRGMDFDKENKWSVPYMSTMTVIAVNKKKCQELGVDIKSFKDLTDEKLNQNIVAVDDCRELVGIALKAAGKDPDTTDEAEIKSVEPWLVQLGKNIKIYDSDTSFSSLAANDVAVGIVYNMDAALAIDENPDIDVIYTEEPCELSVDNFVITANTKNEEAAEKFINFIHEPENYTECLKAYPAISMNEKGFELMDEEYKSNAGANPDKNEVGRAHLIGDVGEAASYYDAVFSAMKN